MRDEKPRSNPPSSRVTPRLLARCDHSSKAGAKLVHPFGVWSGKLEAGESQCRFVEGQGAGAASPGPQRADEGVGKRAAPLFKRDRRRKHFLLVFDNQGVRLEYALESRSDLIVREAVSAIQDPHRLNHSAALYTTDIHMLINIHD